jgi:alpha-beta hydrolase superfamily lysophospholipase
MASDGAGPREHFIRSAGQPIALSVWEAPGSRCSIVFVPGTGVHPLFYSEFLTDVAEAGYTVVGVHPEGHGRSPRPRHALRLQSIITNALDACRWAGAQHGPVILMGSSQGALVALLAAARGAPVIGVIAHNVFDPVDPSAIGITRFSRAAVLQGPLRRSLRALARVAPRLPVPVFAYLDPDRVFTTDESLERFTGDPLCRTSYPLRFVADLFEADTGVLYSGALTVPVVIVTARADPLFALQDTKAQASRLSAPRVDLIVVDADCHLILNDAVPQTLRALLPAVEALVAQSRG